MPTLNWIGKDKVVNHHLDVPFYTLEHKYGFRAEDETDTSETHSGNMIIHGDNLVALKALMPEYEGRINCIYIDPPYNTGNENWIYNDNVNDPHIKKWLGEIVGRKGEDLSRDDKWICMMYPRLVLLQKLLAEDGLIFISIDDNECANLVELCNEIFGQNNYVTTIHWKSRAKPSNTGDARFKPQNDAEYIICYAKQSLPKFQAVLSGKVRSYPHEDKDGRYRLQTILKSNRGENQRETMQFELNGYVPPASKRWQAGEATINDLWKRNRITFQTGEPMLKYYDYDEQDELSPFWCHVPKEISGTAESGKNLLNSILGNQHGFDTVKPIEILEYIFSHCLKKDAIVLDSFAGSGTTAHALLNLNKKDGGNRRFILVELGDYCEGITAQRIKKVMKGYAFKGKKEEVLYSQKLTISKLWKAEQILEEAQTAISLYEKNYTKVGRPIIRDNSIKVIATKEFMEKADGLGGFFDYYELGQPLFKDDQNLNEEVGEDKIRNYIYYTETKQPLKRKRENNSYLLDTHNGTGYYFYYDKNNLTNLSLDHLNIVTEKAEQYIIYADTCTIDEQTRAKMNIIFKKIPRDIRRF